MEEQDRTVIKTTNMVMDLSKKRYRINNRSITYDLTGQDEYSVGLNFV